MLSATSEQEHNKSLTPVPRDRGEQRQTSPEREVQEYKEWLERERLEAEERAAAVEASITPAERARIEAMNLETAKRMQELVEEWTVDIREAQKNVERVEELRALIVAGTASADHMVEAADLLRRGVSPDDDDIADAPCDSEDKSTDRGEDEEAKTGTKRKQPDVKTERKKAEPKTEVNAEKR
jgi:hypothetical protein